MVWTAVFWIHTFYEENNLLDQLDEMLVADEKNGDFSTDDVNEIFRIMHTIKGSSAMMEFNSISTIAHHIEDVFFISVIKESKLWILNIRKSFST